MTPRSWSHPVHRVHLPRPHWPRLPRAPRLLLSHHQAAALRKGVIVALCALLAGGLGWLLRGATTGPLTPTSGAVGAHA